APVGTTLYPSNEAPVIIEKATIRGVESYGMLCAENEIGVGDSSEGIIVLSPDTETGITAYDYYKTSIDTVFEVGLTPNRMDAMSHLGVAKDVCAYMAHHGGTEIKL